MTVIAASSTQALELDLSGLTSVLAVALGIGVILLLVWMWRIRHQLEHGAAPSAGHAEASDSSADVTAR